MQNTINKEVTSLLSRMNREDSPRGLKVVEEHLTTLKFNPLYPMMNFENKAFNWKYFVGELYWYIVGDTNPEIINNFSSFWKGLLDEHGNVNSNYGYIIGPRQHNQFKWAYDALANDKSSRQSIMVFNTPFYQKEGVKDFVCTMYVNFWIRENELNMKVQMRSNDIFYGLQYDAPFFSIVYQSMYLCLKKVYPDLEIGSYYHCSDNTHYYERHFDLVKKLKNEIPNPKNDIEMRIITPIFIPDGDCGISVPAKEFVSYMYNKQNNEGFSSLTTQDYIDIFNKFFVEQ
jgi:thymidylate synthase